jgi:hypothetical protein
MSKCIDCGAKIYPSVRCANCWNDKCGQSSEAAEQSPDVLVSDAIYRAKLNLWEELFVAAKDEHYCRSIRNFLDKNRHLAPLEQSTAPTTGEQHDGREG